MHGARTVVIRDLGDQRDREIAIPGASVLTVDPQPGTAWAHLQLERSETGADAWFGRHDARYDLISEVCDGRIDPPPPPPTLGQYAMVETAWLNLDTGESRTDPSVLAYLGEVGVVKSADGAIRVGSTKVVPRGCNAEVRFASAHPLRVIASCKSAEPRASLELFGPNLHAVLQGTTRAEGASNKVVVMDAGHVCLGDEGCFALQNGVRIPLRGRWEAMHGTSVLTTDGDRHFVTDVATGVTHRLPGVTGDVVAQAEGIVAIDTTIVDLVRARVIGEVVRPPMAVDLHGRALLPASHAERVTPRGPLRWEVPRAMSTSHDSSVDIVDDPPWVPEVVAVDSAGRPMKGVTVRISEPPRVCDVAWWRRFAYWATPVCELLGYGRSGETDAHGRFRWIPRRFVTQTVALHAADGRTARPQHRPGQTRLEIPLRPPGVLHMLCKGFPTQEPYPGIVVVVGVSMIKRGATCEETTIELPAGRYLLWTEVGAAPYTVRDVEVPSGGVVNVVIEPPRIATIRGRVVEPLAGMECFFGGPRSRLHGDEERGVASAVDGTFVLHGAEGRVRLWCVSPAATYTADVIDVDLRGDASITVRVVRARPDALDVGVKFGAEPGGARISQVSRRARSAGLRPGDLVRAVDGVSLAGLSPVSMFVLAFEFPPEATIHWDVERDGHAVTIIAPSW